MAKGGTELASVRTASRPSPGYVTHRARSIAPRIAMYTRHIKRVAVQESRIQHLPDPSLTREAARETHVWFRKGSPEWWSLRRHTRAGSCVSELSFPEREVAAVRPHSRSRYKLPDEVPAICRQARGR
ncbi:50S ribosomal protein L16 [Streptomyces thioluteus]|uniref:50S ribosomal protein L16 n=1 Tax=Streptomyces thioluteus TaxID=66431 RepID=A0ABN3WFY5_STRTU